ncbi:hypothetical protein DFR42_1011351 [Undibacterium pigrum]|uniref:Uncharacterized protein n=1 Tax=Undibacterium pigrum TaxID=401470 RepID=A0A318JK76_9BURK|nr:hypothetical protein DFR42_1011351 [Undibacterium pigrum]
MRKINLLLYMLLCKITRHLNPEKRKKRRPGMWRKQIFYRKMAIEVMDLQENRLEQGEMQCISLPLFARWWQTEGRKQGNIELFPFKIKNLKINTPCQYIHF